jgi:predicted nucleic acid-binding protein
VRAALRAYSQGVDFADALHLALSCGDEAFMSFDKGFVRKAAKLGLGPRVVQA